MGHLWWPTNTSVAWVPPLWLICWHAFTMFSVSWRPCLMAPCWLSELWTKGIFVYKLPGPWYSNKGDWAKLINAQNWCQVYHMLKMFDGPLAAILCPMCVLDFSWSDRDTLSANPSFMHGPISSPTRWKKLSQTRKISSNFRHECTRWERNCLWFVNRPQQTIKPSVLL